jgi:hypothetical protein
MEAGSWLDARDSAPQFWLLTGTGDEAYPHEARNGTGKPSSLSLKMTPCINIRSATTKMSCKEIMKTGLARISAEALAVRFARLAVQVLNGGCSPDLFSRIIHGLDGSLRKCG